MVLCCQVRRGHPLLSASGYVRRLEYQVDGELHTPCVDQTIISAYSLPSTESPSATHPPSSLNIMHPHDVLHPTPVRDLKRTVTDLEFGSEPASKRTRLSPDQLPTPPYSTQDGHPEQSSRLYDSSDWRERLKSSLLRRLDNHYSPTTKQLTANP